MVGWITIVSMATEHNEEQLADEHRVLRTA